jgi:peptide chain release factor 2
MKKNYKGKEIELSFDGPHDQKDALVYIYSGAGGVEAMDWANMLSAMYRKYFDKKGFNYSEIERAAGEEAGIKRVGYEVTGLNAFGWLKSEKGVHRLVRLSPFNADNLRHTSFALVEVLPKVDKIGNEEIDPSELKIDFYKAGGAGGQHVNKTCSAVRITHLPTKIVVTSQGQRSQHQNKDKALQILYSKLVDLKERENVEKIKDLKGEQKEIAWGNQARSYVLHPYKMVRDHRTRLKVADAEGVLDGDLDRFVYEYLRIETRG